VKEKCTNQKYMYQRKSKGSLVGWLLFIAIAGLSIVTGLIAMELLVRWISLGRVQSAAREAAMVYARDMIRLRDNQLSARNSTDLSFQSAGLNEGSHTNVVGVKANIQGAEKGLEYLNASQVLLYNVWGQRIKDASQVGNVQQLQCYKPNNSSRFYKNPNSPLAECNVIGNVTSPIMQLRWNFAASTYGFGMCCAALGDTNNKDFCVNVNVSGRMDPILAGGMPFLQNIDFIRVGDFNVNQRVVVMKMGTHGSTADAKNVANNLSGETIAIENIPSNLSCDASPPPLPVALDPPTVQAQEAPPTSPTLSPELPDFTLPNIPNNPPIPAELKPECPDGMVAAVLSQTSSSLDYTCNLQASPPPVVSSPSSPAIPPIASMGSGSTSVPQNCSYTIQRASGWLSNNAKNTADNGFMTYLKAIADAKGFTDDAYVSKDWVVVGYKPVASANRSAGRGGSGVNCNSGWDQRDPSKCQPVKEYKALEMWSNELQRMLPSDAVGTTFTSLLSEIGITGRLLQAWDSLLKQTALGYEGQAVGYQFFFDANGNRIPSAGQSICGSASTPSPISLVWSQDNSSIAEDSVSKFPLIYGLNDKWFHWKASAERPLLVIDPKHKGLITSASQLFGNFTFGKNWTDGYQALASLDKNRDSRISGSELDPLALWFDKNRDGVSQKGEVKPVKAVGVLALFYKVSSTDLQTNDVSAKIGYLRKISGRKVVGQSIDWYGEGPFDSKQEALANKQYIVGIGSLNIDQQFIGRMKK
jgi:hypothetical protein